MKEFLLTNVLFSVAHFLYGNKMVRNCIFLIYNFLQDYLLNRTFLCKKWFLFLVEIKRNYYKKICAKGLWFLCTINRVVADQMTIPLNDLPWFWQRKENCCNWWKRPNVIKTKLWKPLGWWTFIWKTHSTNECSWKAYNFCENPKDKWKKLRFFILKV